MKFAILSAAVIAASAASAPVQAKTWHVMINHSEAPGDASCDGGLYKISTKAPLVIQGPETINAHHAQAVLDAWLDHMYRRSTAAFNWIHQQPTFAAPQIYFRKTEKEAIDAFVRDGHFIRPKGNCRVAALVKLSVASFEFVPPEGFSSSSFGEASAATYDAGLIDSVGTEGL